MSLIQRFRHNKWLSKEFGINEPTPAPTLERSIQPVAVLADATKFDPFQGGPEIACSVGAVGSAAAAHFAAVALINPLASDVVILVDKVVLSDTGIFYIQLEKGSAVAASLAVSVAKINKNARHLDLTDLPAPQGAVRQGNLAVLPTLFHAVIDSGGIAAYFDFEPFPFVLDNNDALLCFTDTPNVNMRAWLQWREIPKLPPSV